MRSGWDNITAHGDFRMETFVRIYGATGNDTDAISGSDAIGSYKDYYKITAPIIRRDIMPESKPTVGNCVSGNLSFTVMTTDEIPKSARMVVYSSVISGGGTYGPKQFGTFWVNRRTYNENMIDIEAYDAMLMGNQIYSDDSPTLNWPKTIKTVVSRIAVQMGISLDTRTATIINGAFGALNIITKPNDDWPLLTVLGYIGGIYGGNWYITDENELMLLPLVDKPQETHYILDDTFEKVQTDGGDYLISEGTSTTHVDNTHPIDGCGMIYVPVVTGAITTANAIVISKVTMTLDSTHTYSYGDSTGYELQIQNNPYASNQLCNELYTMVNGMKYAPYNITNAVYNPLAEPGDWIIAGDYVCGVVYNQTRKFGIGFSADVSTPGEDEIAEEYPYKTASQRLDYLTESLTNSTSELRSEITQTQTSIMASVSETYQPKEIFTSKLIRSTLYFLATDYSFNPGEDENWSTTLPPKEEGKSCLWVYSEELYEGVDEHNYYGTKTFKIKTEPTVLSYVDYVDEDNLIVERIFYTSNVKDYEIYCPSTRVTSTSTSPLGWRKVIPLQNETYRYLYAKYQYYANGQWHFSPEGPGTEKIVDDVTTVAGYMNRTTAEIANTGYRIDSIHENYVDKTSVRSTFALDPTNITLSAGVDERGNPTGQITFNAGTFIVNSDNFTVDASGHMTCSAADITGEDDNGYWVNYRSNYIQYGYTKTDGDYTYKVNSAKIYFGSYTSGHHDLALECEDFLTLKTNYRIRLQAQYGIDLATSSISITEGSSSGQSHTAFTGYIYYVEWIHDLGGGNIEWQSNRMYFVNGLLTTTA